MTPNKSQQIRTMPKKKSGNLKWIIIGIIAIAVIGFGAYAVTRPPPGGTNNPMIPAPTPGVSPGLSSSNNGTIVLLQTTAGNITIQLRTDKPITTANFINIVQKGWYDGTIFHRVIAGFMIQGGAISETVPPIQDEIGTNNRNLPYTIAMAKTNQPNSGTSEFFINVVDNGQNPLNPGFDSTYTVFGNVTSGQSVVDAIANATVTANPNNPNENSLPLNPVTITKASIIS
jgi:cyclophilin family peptidyl-prolyl cis-trans isomerase